jgi:hypothetical protein
MPLQENGNSVTGVGLETTNKKAHGPGLAGLMIGMGLFVIIGIPMIFYIWRFINELLSGRFILADAALATVLLVIFIGFLRILGKQVRRWDGQLDS